MHIWLVEGAAQDEEDEEEDEIKDLRLARQPARKMMTQEKNSRSRCRRLWVCVRAGDSGRRARYANGGDFVPSMLRTYGV